MKGFFLGLLVLLCAISTIDCRNVFTITVGAQSPILDSYGQPSFVLPNFYPRGALTIFNGDLVRFQSQVDFLTTVTFVSNGINGTGPFFDEVSGLLNPFTRRIGGERALFRGSSTAISSGVLQRGDEWFVSFRIPNLVTETTFYYFSTFQNQMSGSITVVPEDQNIDLPFNPNGVLSLAVTQIIADIAAAEAIALTTDYTAAPVPIDTLASGETLWQITAGRSINLGTGINAEVLRFFPQFINIASGDIVNIVSGSTFFDHSFTLNNTNFFGERFLQVSRDENDEVELSINPIYLTASPPPNSQYSNGFLNSGVLRPGQSYQIQFNTIGAFAFRSITHIEASMVGILVST